MGGEPIEIWRVVEIARYRSVTTAQVYKSLKSYPLEPDFIAGNVPMWRPESVKAWAQKLPGRGKYTRSSANEK